MGKPKPARVRQPTTKQRPPSSLKPTKPTSQTQLKFPPPPPPQEPVVVVQLESGASKNMNKQMAEEEEEILKEVTTVPLSVVVSDCVKRWFTDTLKEAKAGDVNMQVLVGQMYFNGYGVTRDHHKGKIWMTRASRVRSSVWKVSNKRPGYNASDSDSDELIGDS